MSRVPRIAIVGTGNVGSALGCRLAATGHPVVFGVREGREPADLLGRCGPNASAATVTEAAAGADIVILAVPAAAALEVARSLGPLEGKVIVDCTNPVRWDQGPIWNPPAEGSNAAAIAAAMPGNAVVKAFSTFGAEFHADPTVQGGTVDVQMAGDDAGAKRLVAEVATKAGFTVIDAGPLRNAALLENLAVLWIHLATVGGFGREMAFKLLGRS